VAGQPLADWPIVRALGRQRYLALSLLAFLCVLPLTDEATYGARLMRYGVLILVFITGPLAVARTRGTLIATFVLALLVLLPGLASTLGEIEAAYRYSLLAGILFFSFLAGLLIYEFLIKNVKVDAETLWGAVNIYVLMGLCFAFWYAALSLFEPGLFDGKFMNEPLRDQLMGFIYFSFVTITTLGYGDITPSSTGVATLTYLEALIGQLYVAIMIARLVGLYAARSE
jgi:voltage-gated potassium channel